MKEVLLEEVFRLLEEATRLEKSGHRRIEAATKYYESCYLMRQIVATAQAQSAEGKSSSSGSSSGSNSDQTIGTSSRRLLQDKIDHYTAIARGLYFDEETHPITPIKSQQPEQPQPQPQQQEHPQPATSVMIGLLDDAMSVLTEIQTIPPPIPVPVLGFHNKKETTTPSPRRHNSRTLPTNPTSPVVPSNYNHYQNNYKLEVNTYSPRNHQGNHQIAGRKGNHPNPPRKQSPKQKPQQHQFQKPKLPRCAFAAIERRIHLQANLGHSTLSKAIDLDERHTKGHHPNTRAEAIATYVEASELYLGAIQLGREQLPKLEAARARRPRSSASSSSSAALVETMTHCLNNLLTKLKGLLASTLDRVEALKKEEQDEQRHRHYQNPVMASASIATSKGSNKLIQSWPHWPPMHHWYRAKENLDHNHNPQPKKEEPNSSAPPGSRRQSPTTVMW